MSKYNGRGPCEVRGSCFSKKKDNIQIKDTESGAVLMSMGYIQNYECKSFQLKLSMHPK